MSDDVRRSAAWTATEAARRAAAAWTEVAAAWAEVAASGGGPTGEEAVAERAAESATNMAKVAAWAWLQSAVGARTSADEASNDAGPSEADLRGEVQHGS